MGELGCCLTSLGWVSSKRQVRKVLWRILIITGCVIFLASMLNPFLKAHWTSLGIIESQSSWPGEMWSFKQQFYYLRGSLSTLPHVELSFGQYWLQDWDNWYGVAGWTGYALVFMFLLQVLTITSCTIVIFKSSLYLILLPTFLSSLIGVLIIAVSNATLEGYTRTFQLGFWLTLLSIASFLSGAIAYYFPRRHKDSIGERAG